MQTDIEGHVANQSCTSMGKQPQFNPQSMLSNVLERDIDGMSWIAINSIRMPMNDMSSTSHKKDKLPINAMTDTRKKHPFHP
jgi:hypothetical protein